MGKDTEVEVAVTSLINGLKVITFSGKDYIGRIEKTETGHRVFDAYPMEGHAPKSAWMKAEFKNELYEFDINDATAYVSRPLTKKETLDFQKLVLSMDQAKEMAPLEAVCEYFDRK